MGLTNEKLGPIEETEKPTLSSKEKAKTIENLRTAMEEKVEQIREDFEDRMKKSSPDVSERAIGKWEQLMIEQIKEVKKFYQYEIDKLKQASSRREAFVGNIVEQVNEKANTRRMMILMLMESKMEGEYVTTEEVADIDESLQKITEFVKTNPRIEKTYNKINSKEKLTKEDYQVVINMIEPVDMTKISPNSPEAFRATFAGTLMGVMSMDQRKELVKQFKESNKKEHTADFVDILLRLGLLSDEDGVDLVKGTQDEQQIAQKVEKGFYKEERDRMDEARKEYRAQREQFYKQYRGKYNKNIVEKVISGKGILGIGTFVWGFLTTAINVMALKKKGEKPHQWLGRVAKNPYVYAGLGGMAAGAEITGSNLKAGTWFGAGPVSRVVGDVLEDNEKEPEIADYKANAREQLAKVRESSPKQFIGYLEHGGFSTMQELRAKIDREKKFRSAKGFPLHITVEELLQMETDPEQKARLQALKGKNEQAINKNLTITSEAAYALQISTNDAFVTEFKKATT